MIIEDTRGQGFKGSSDNTQCIFSSRKAQPSALNAKSLQRFESLAKVIQTLSIAIQNNSKIPKGRKTTRDYIKMLYISYGSIYELETQIS